MATIRKHLFGNSYLLFFIIVQFLLAFFKNLLFAILEFARLFADGTESNAGPALIKNFIKVALSGTYGYGDGKYGETAYNQ